MDDYQSSSAADSSRTRRQLVSSRLFVGVAFVLVGILFTMHTLDMVSVGSIGDWWPLILVAVGLAKLAQPDGTEGKVWGAFLVLFFGLWLAHNLDLVEVHPVRLWPVVLVFVGAAMIWRATRGPRAAEAACCPPPVEPPPPGLGLDAPEPPPLGEPAPAPEATPPQVAQVPSGSSAGGAAATASSVVSALALLGGTERHCVSKDFRGGDATAVMGGCKIDLRDAAIASSPAILETFAWWGGIEIKVPQEWTVVTEGTAILGAYEDKTRHRPSSREQTLVIRGAAIMGGVEVSN